MTSQILSAGPGYSKDLLLTIMEMTEIKFTCDFTIKADNKLFPVHRNVIAAASKCFKTMISSNMRETQQGCADIKTIQPSIMKKCITFMYTGEVEVIMTEIPDILHASNLLQLDKLTELCFQYLQENLSVDNCLMAIQLARFYNKQELYNNAGEIMLRDFQEVVSFSEFFQITLDELKHYLAEANANHEVKWKAVIKWLAIRHDEVEQVLPKLVESINDLPFYFLLNTVLNEPLVQNNETLTNLVTVRLFSDLEEVGRNLNLENFFNVRKISKIQHLPNAKKLHELMNEFLRENFVEILQKDKFVDLDEKEIIFLLRSPQPKCFSERIKWKAALKWCKHDQRRKKLFPELFKCIRLKNFPLNYIRETIRSEPLVRESRKCSVILLDALSARAAEQPSTTQTDDLQPHIVCLNTRSGTIQTLNIRNKSWNRLPDVPEKNNVRIVNVNNYLFAIGGNEIFQLERNEAWTRKASIQRELVYRETVSFRSKIYLVDDHNMLCFDPGKNSWENDLPGCGLDDGFCVAASDDFIYALGGLRSLKEAKKFDPRTRTWSYIPSMKNERRRAATAVFKGNVYVMGGYDEDDVDHNSVEYFNHLTNSWNEVARMRCPRYGHFSCVVYHDLYVVGGQNDDDGFVNSIEIYDSESNQWSFVEVTGFSENTWLRGCTYSM